MSGSDKTVSLACPLCDSDVPADPDVKLGEILYCSYCKIGLKVIRGKGEKLVLEFEDEEG